MLGIAIVEIDGLILHMDIFRFTARSDVRKHAAKKRRHKSRNRAQYRERQAEQRVCRQYGIHARRRSRDEETHARPLARAFLAERNRRRNHTAAANRERDAEKRRPQHGHEIRFRNLRDVQVVRHPHVQNSRKQKTEQQERRHLGKQRDEFVYEFSKNICKRFHIYFPFFLWRM